MAKFRVTMKDPDYSRAESVYDPPEVREVLDKFIEYDEYITIEFDTETRAARVIPIKEK
jgi:hypothetical protein